VTTPPEEKPKYEALRSAGLLLAIPTLLIVSPLVGFFIGMATDRWLKTKLVFSVIGLALGFAAAGRETWRIIRRVQEEERERSKRP
jgi:F0F1-type ATP synthase assembly protein I